MYEAAQLSSGIRSYQQYYSYKMVKAVGLLVRTPNGALSTKHFAIVSLVRDQLLYEADFDMLVEEIYECDNLIDNELMLENN